MKPRKITLTKTIVHFNHNTAERLFKNSNDIDRMPIPEVIDRIIRVNTDIKKFWGRSFGWAPLKAAHLLSKARLDWQICLSKNLNIYVYPEDSHDGYLILGWANLGALMEGTLKLFLSVYYDQKVTIKNYPDGLTLEPLKQFFRKNIWGASQLDKIIDHVQQRRNVIHSFQSKNIGDFNELYLYMRFYLKMLRYINFRLPYPDDIYIPKEADNDNLIPTYIDLLKNESLEVRSL